jgi:hypothetical protein
VGCRYEPGACNDERPQIEFAAQPDTLNDEPLPFKIRRGPARLVYLSPIVKKFLNGAHRLIKAIVSDESACSERLQQRKRSRQT